MKKSNLFPLLGNVKRKKKQSKEVNAVKEKKTAEQRKKKRELVAFCSARSLANEKVIYSGGLTPDSSPVTKQREK